MLTIFIDGEVGTTGLRLRERLSAMEGLSLLTLPEDRRKDVDARREALNACDVAFLCLPDDAARQAAALVTDPHVTVLDTSTAHRTAPGWAYGFPELGEAWREAVQNARRIAVPGCHASGFVALVYPLVAAGLLPASAKLSCFSLTGYSGGGRKMIAEYEGAGRSPLLDAPRQYALAQQHKHLREMKAVTGLETEPIFSPVVADYYSGMEVTVPLFESQLAPGFGAQDVRAVYRSLYVGPVVRFVQDGDEGGFLAANSLSGRDVMEISVHGGGGRLLLTARFDNLGKGASGAAVECMDLACGRGTTDGLVL